MTGTGEDAVAAPAVAVSGLTHRYGERTALDSVSFEVRRGEIFGLLGPNGGGKTTVFRILSTLIPLQSGTARVLGRDVAREPSEVRRLMGVVFQAPSLDVKLTAQENLIHQGHLYGLRGAALRARAAEMLARFGLTERAGERAERLSGGLRRRVELAKGMLHRPELLLLDEPSTGLDPGARRDLMEELRDLRAKDGVTSVLTTHILEEAEGCDRLAILDRGRLVAIGSPQELKRSIGGEVIVALAKEPGRLRDRIQERFGGEPTVLDDGSVRLERERAHEFVAQLVEAFPGEIDAVSLGKPTLEDVFIRRTGHRFWQAARNGRNA